METDQPLIPLIPLTPAVFYILLALASRERHGYEIMKQVKQDSHGQVKMGTGTLYGSLKRMLADGLIEEAGERSDPALDDERRRYYRLTDQGRRAFTAELRRYEAVVSLAQRRRLLVHPRPQPSVEPGL
jgi:DNA-binding PadR family transcriptional regulator